MRRDPVEMSRREYDLVIVGCGIFGASLAWEGVSRGLSVALLERDDFGHATSANSFKMVHGGIRYLQHGDLPRIRESCRERSSLLRVAPHLVRPLPIAVPTYSSFMKSKTAMRAAFAIYDSLTFDRNRGISDPLNRIPGGRIISRRECLDLFPQLKPEGVTGAAVFCDGQMYNPTRLTLAFLRSAVEAGADVANYAEVTGLLRRDGGVAGVTARDRLSRDEFEVRGRLVINAAGPYAGPLLARTVPEAGLQPSPTFSRDACFVVPRRLTPDVALATQGDTADPDALLSRGARHLFLVPWRDCTLIGVWHVVYDGDPDRFTVTESEIEEWIAEVRRALPSLDVDLKDVSLWNAGLVLFGQNEPGAKDLSYGKRSIIVDHARDHGIEGLMTVIGVRYTTARGVAARTVDTAFSKLGKSPVRSRTDVLPVHGGEYERFQDLERAVRARESVEIPEPLIEPLLRNHGARYGDVLDYVERDASLGAPVGSSTTLLAEIPHAVEREMAVSLGDVIFRRTDIGTGQHPGEEGLRICARLMATALGWSEQRQREEVDSVESRFFRFPSATASCTRPRSSS